MCPGQVPAGESIGSCQSEGSSFWQWWHTYCVSGSLIVKSSKQNLEKEVTKQGQDAIWCFLSPDAILPFVCRVLESYRLHPCLQKTNSFVGKTNKVFHSSLSMVVDPGIPIRGHGASKRISG